MVAGGFDYLLKVRVRDMAAYRSFLGEALAKVPGIRSTHTYAVMERVKESRGDRPLAPAGSGPATALMNGYVMNPRLVFANAPMFGKT